MPFSKSLVQNYDILFAKKDIDSLAQSFNKKEKFLFECYLNGQNDRYIAKEVYNCTPSHQTFQSLKKSLREKLLENIPLVHTGTEIQRARTRIYRNTAIIHILDVFGLRKLFVPLGKKTINKALHYHMFHEAAGIARLLAHHYVVYEKNTVKGQEYFQMLNHALGTFKLEAEVQYQYAQMQLQFQGKDFNERADEFAAIADSIQQKMKTHSSIRVCTFYYLIRYAQHYAKNDFAARIRVSKEALEYFDSLPFNSDITKNIFIFNLVNSYLECNELTRAELILLSFINNARETSFQYYRFRELLFRVYLFQGKTEKVNQEFEYLKKNIRKMESVFTRNRLLIYGIYVDILNGRNSNFRKINYNLNKVKQDKKGLHVPLLIGQAIQSYLHDTDKFIDNYDALRQYCYRYLQSEEYNRTNVFVKKLGQLLEVNGTTATSNKVRGGMVSRNSLEMISYDQILSLLTGSKEKVVAARSI